MQVDAVLAEHAGDVVEQSRPISRDDAEQVILPALVGPDMHLRLDGEMLQLPRDPSPDGWRQGRIGRQSVGEIVLDERDHLAVMRCAGRPHHLESVQRITVPGGMDLRIENGAADAPQVTANAREQLRTVRRVDHDLQTLSRRREACLDHGLLGVYAVMHLAGLPGDFLRVVAHEIGDVQLLPERFLHAVR